MYHDAGSVLYSKNTFTIAVWPWVKYVHLNMDGAIFNDCVLRWLNRLNATTLLWLRNIEVDLELISRVDGDDEPTGFTAAGM